jgi:aspartyl-tRNA(Asn)/glutamyl-tRNA(Gln) amidotransferase subunit B
MSRAESNATTDTSRLGSDPNRDVWSFNGWEMVVGLEVHVELATRTKLFSGSPNRFGD